MTSTLKYSTLKPFAAEIKRINILPEANIPINIDGAEVGGEKLHDPVSCQLEHSSLKDPQILASKLPLNWEESGDVSSFATFRNGDTLGAITLPCHTPGEILITLVSL